MQKTKLISQILFIWALTVALIYQWAVRVLALGDEHVASQVNDPIASYIPTWATICQQSFFLIFIYYATTCLATKANKNLHSSYLKIYFLLVVYIFLILLPASNQPIQYLTTSSGFSKMGPITVLMIGVLFYAANPRSWSAIEPAIIVFSYVGMVIWIIALTILPDYSRWVAIKWLHAPTLAIEIAPLIIWASLREKPAFFRLIGLAPIVIILISAILLQTRLTIIILLVNILIYTILTTRSILVKQDRIYTNKINSNRTFNFLIAIFVLPLIGALLYKTSDLFAEALNGFIFRIDEDTRSNQIAPFFEKLWAVLPLGAGYPAPGEYTAEGMEGIDVGYLNTLYITGIPTMLALFFLIVRPSIKAIFLKKITAVDASIIAASFGLVVKMMSSMVPNFDFQFVIFILVAGRCAHLVNRESRSRLQNYKLKFLISNKTI